MNESYYRLVEFQDGKRKVLAHDPCVTTIDRVMTQLIHRHPTATLYYAVFEGQRRPARLVWRNERDKLHMVRLEYYCKKKGT